MFVCYVIVRLCFMCCLCHKRPGTLKVVEVTALICVTFEKVEGGQSALVLSFTSAMKKKFQWIVFNDVNDVLS